ncbi:MAG: response regulator [Bacteriovoracaceae bacterium]|jgi:CheY-like chemotaxis protein|nr:response regulator [Bacteriovoracaceae bacterium]
MFKYVLIIDDDIGVQDVMKDYFIEYGVSRHNIFTASNPMEALDIFSLNKEHISLVVCDHYMPLANGPEICDLMKKENPRLPIILHTGDLNITIDTLKSVDYILYKPCSFDEIFRVIKKDKISDITPLENNEPQKVVDPYQIGHVRDKYGKTYLGTVSSQSKGGCAMSFQVPVNMHEDNSVEVSLGCFEEKNNDYSILFKSKAKVVWTKIIDATNIKVGLQFL